MPSPGEDIHSWSTVAINNGTTDPLIDWHEGQARASVNNSSRSEMAAIAKHRNLNNGSIVTTGTANAQAFLSGVTYESIPSGLTARLKVGGGLTNTASMTLNMDGIGATLVKTANGDNLRGGEFVADCYVDLLYNGTNWIFLYSQQFIDDQLHGGGGIIIGKQVFSTPGTFTYTPTPGTECAIIDCLGGGGGGTGTPNPSVGGIGGGGGGAGGYSRAFKNATEIGGSQTVIVGAKGTGGAIGGGGGTNGGDTSVGSLCVAKGGSAAAANAGLNSDGGAGGIAGTGDVTGTGESGEPGLAHIQVLSGISGRGGDTAYGSGGAGITTSTGAHGNAATGFGAGGGGGAAYGGFSATTGGDGSGGLVVIMELAGRGAPGSDGVDGAQGPIGPPGPSGPGTGDVLRSGTPSNGQLAQWTDASHIEGVNFNAAIAPYAIKNVVIQTFTASGTYTPTFGLKYCIIECIGGGGGGGVGYGSAAGAMYMIGGGGGSGGYSRHRATATDIGLSQAVTIGAAGAGGTPGTGSNGAAGGDTSVGALCVARGGAGGQFTSDTPVQNGLGGAGGVAGVGDVVAAGAPGDGGFFNAVNNLIGCRSGLGGSSVMGGGAAATNAGHGFNAGNYGSGGSGGASADGVPYNGGNGSPGFIVITDFI
jgi:hypothetical protein